MAYTKYSLTPADNNAAPPNGAPEGMLPSGVNDTMRDMMSQIRDVGDGIRGGTYTMTAPVITGGSINDTIIGATTATTATFTTATVNRVADSQGGSVAPISSVMRNRIINGAMVIDQRNNGASVTITSSQFGVDRMSYEVSQASKLSAQQNAGSVTPPVGFVNYQGTTSLSAYSSTSTDYFWVRQNIEGYNTSDLNWGTANAKTVTVSFWAYSSLTGSFSATLCNDSNNRCFPFSYSIPVANTWTYITQTVTGDTTGTWATTTSAGIRLIWNLGTGSSRQTTGGAWVAGDYRGGVTGSVSLVGTNGATFYITGVQLEKGTQATSFEYRQYGTELTLCQRYYETSGTTAFGNGISFRGYVVSGSDYSAKAYFQVTKRAAPTVSLTNEFNIAFPATPGAAGGIGDRGFNENRTANANSNSGLFSTYYTASAEL